MKINYIHYQNLLLLRKMLWMQLTLKIHMLKVKLLQHIPLHVRYLL